MVIAGCGTSYHAGLFGAMIMRELESFNTVQVIIGSEAAESSYPKINAGLLSIS